MTNLVAKRVRDLRKRLGLNQIAFAGKFDVTQSTVSKWEKGLQKPSLAVAAQMARAAGIDVTEFASDEFEQLFGEGKYGWSIDVVAAISNSIFVSNPFWEEKYKFRFQMPYLPDPAYFLKGYLVKDRSASLVFDKESIVIAADPVLGVVEPENLDVLVMLLQQETMSRLVLRQLWRRADEAFVTSLASSDPRLQHEERMTIDIQALSDGRYRELGLLGVVVGGYSIFPRFRHRMMSVFGTFEGMEDDDR